MRLRRATRYLLPSELTEPDPSSHESDEEVDEMLPSEDILSTTLGKRKAIPGDSPARLKSAKVTRVSDRICAAEGTGSYTVLRLEILALKLIGLNRYKGCDGEHAGSGSFEFTRNCTFEASH
jgi:hypothetical protein